MTSNLVPHTLAELVNDMRNAAETLRGWGAPDDFTIATTIDRAIAALGQSIGLSDETSALPKSVRSALVQIQRGPPSEMDNSEVAAWAAGLAANALDSVPSEKPSELHECALQDIAYASGAKQALAMAHQSLRVADQWVNGGCSGRIAPAMAVLAAEKASANAFGEVPGEADPQHFGESPYQIDPDTI